MKEMKKKQIRNSSNEKRNVRNCFGCFKNKLTVANSFNRASTIECEESQLFFHFEKPKKCNFVVVVFHKFSSIDIHSDDDITSPSAVASHVLLFCVIDFLPPHIVFRKFLPPTQNGENMTELRQWMGKKHPVENSYYAIVVVIYVLFAARGAKRKILYQMSINHQFGNP